MRTRVSLSLPVLVLVAVAALVLGSLGTATAAGLTKGKVKKVAAKVVKKAAPTLSVSHATTADSATTATNLQGRPPSDYQNPARRFRLTVEAQAASRTYSFPGLPAGSYLVGYDVFATVATSGASLTCQLRANASSAWESFSGSSSYQPYNPTSQGTALLELTSAPPQLSCSATGSTFSIYSSSNYLSTVTFTRVDGITSQYVTSTRAASDGAARPQAR